MTVPWNIPHSSFERDISEKESKSQKTDVETRELSSGLASLDGGAKVLLVGGVCFFLLIVLYCLYRICCYMSDPTDEMYLQQIKNIPLSQPQSSEYSSGRASAKKSESQPHTDPNKQERKPKKVSAPPVGQIQNLRSLPRGAPRAPSLQPIQDDPAKPEQETQEPSFENVRGQERIKQRQFEDISDRAPQSRLDKAARHLKRLLRLSKEERLGPEEIDQTNILDAMGAVDQPMRPTATQSSVTPAVAPSFDPGTPAAAPGYEPIMQEIQGSQETPKPYGW